MRRRTYLRDQNPVAALDAHGHPLAVLVERAGADGKHLALVELLDARLGQEDAACRLGLGLDALHQHAVEQRDEGLDGADRGGLGDRNKHRLACISSNIGLFALELQQVRVERQGHNPPRMDIWMATYHFDGLRSWSRKRSTELAASLDVERFLGRGWVEAFRRGRIDGATLKLKLFELHRIIGGSTFFLPAAEPRFSRRTADAATSYWPIGLEIWYLLRPNSGAPRCKHLCYFGLV